MPFILSSWTVATPGRGPSPLFNPTHTPGISLPASHSSSSHRVVHQSTRCLAFLLPSMPPFWCFPKVPKEAVKVVAVQRAHKPGQHHLQWASGPSFLRTHHLPAEQGRGAGRGISLPAFPGSEWRQNQVQLAFEAISIEWSQKCCSSTQRIL